MPLPLPGIDTDPYHLLHIENYPSGSFSAKVVWFD